jgi:hypothetical protein
MTLITDAAKIQAIVAAGKYREHLPFWTRDGNGLWVQKPVEALITGNRGWAWKDLA